MAALLHCVPLCVPAKREEYICIPLLLAALVNSMMLTLHYRHVPTQYGP